jgi:hypothetical protein
MVGTTRLVCSRRDCCRAQAGTAAVAQALKANSSDVYPARPPHALPNGAFALHFDYPVENLAAGDYLAVCASCGYRGSAVGKPYTS